jgi:hypothetical protein
MFFDCFESVAGQLLFGSSQGQSISTFLFGQQVIGIYRYRIVVMNGLDVHVYIIAIDAASNGRTNSRRYHDGNHL